MYKLYVCIKDEMTKEVLSQVAKDIYVEDKTFKFSIFKGKYGECMYIMSVECINKDNAYRRGVWLKENVDKSLMFWVKEVKE